MQNDIPAVDAAFKEFGAVHDRTRRGINILDRVASLDTALEMLEIWGAKKRLIHGFVK